MNLRQRVAATLLAILVAVAAGGLAVVSPAAASPVQFAAMAVSNPQQGVPYTIRAYSNTNQCIDIRAASQDNGAFVQMYQCLGPSQSNQIFYLWNVPGTQIYQIQAAHSWKCLDVQGYSYQDWAYIQQYDCLGMSQQNQLFGIQPLEAQNNYSSTMIAMHSWKYVHIGVAENSASVVQHSSPSSWKFYQY